VILLSVHRPGFVCGTLKEYRVRKDKFDYRFIIDFVANL
jgi:hypothetical protein